MKRAVDSVLETIAGQHATERCWLVGAPYFEPPEVLRTELSHSASAFHFNYPPIEGLASFREAIKTLHASFGQEISAEHVLPTHGAKGGLLAAFAAILKPGDEILHPVPCYPAYTAMAKMLGVSTVGIEQPGGQFSWDEASLEEKMTSRTRAIVLSSPANPNGATLSNEQAQFLVEFCRNHDLKIICDEAYEAFRFAKNTEKGPSFWDPDMQTVVQVRSISKTYALCGWRLGYLVADQQVIAQAKQWQSSILNPPNILAQQAMAGVGAVPQSYLETQRGEILKRLHKVASALGGAGLRTRVPDGGFYLWAKLSSPSSLNWCVEVARKYGIALWPGEDFGAPGWVRISVAACSPEAWQLAVERLGGIR